MGRQDWETGRQHQQTLKKNTPIAMVCAPVGPRWTHFHTQVSLITCSRPSFVLQSLIHDAEYHFAFVATIVNQRVYSSAAGRAFLLQNT